MAMKGCGGAHYWGREICKFGLERRLILLAHIKSFVKRQKEDAADADSISEAALRPAMRFAPLKSEDTQGAAIDFRIRKL